VVSKSGQVICAARETGQVYWIRDLNEGVKGKKVGGFLGIGAKRVLKPLWSSLLLANGRLLTASSEGEMAVLNAKTGEVQRKFKLSGDVLLGPIAAGGMVYVVTDEAQLIALR
jgi:outer membrane protein assembly factor BamB